MVHDPQLLEWLEGFERQRYAGEVYRATRLTLDPLVSSTSGGRWAPKGGPRTSVPVLYTSLKKEGAIAEVVSYWRLLTPQPSKPLVASRLRVTARATLRLLMADLKTAGIDAENYRSRSYLRSQEIGAAAAFLGVDGLIVPSARWDCENLVLFMDNHLLPEKLEILEREELDWRAWADTHLSEED